MGGDDQARDVGGQQRIAVSRRLDAEHVGGGAAQVAAAQGVGQRLFVDQAATGGIDQEGARLHQRQFGGAEHPAGVLGQRAVQGQGVDPWQEVAKRQAVEAMRSQVEHAERTAEQAGAAEGALDEVVAAIHTIGVMAERIAEGSTQQSQAVGEIRSHSERIHALGGENLRLIGHSREQGEQLRQLGGDLRTTVQAFRL